MKTLRKFISIAVVSGLISVGAATSAHADTLVLAATETVATATVDAVVTDLSDGGQLYTYDLPDGSVMSVPYPPADFNPLTASDEQLAQYDIEPKPTDPTGAQLWAQRLASYYRGESPSTTLEVPLPNSPSFATIYNSPWVGWEVGQPGVSASTYLAIHSNFTVPTVQGLCASTQFGIWIGLGGNSTATNDLVQQGLGWCWMQQSGPPTPGFHPFLEFANTQLAVAFCGQLNWTLGATHDIFQSLSYDSRAGKANFWMQDLAPGGATHNCALTKPSGWVFNGATAEWVIEDTQTTYPNFSDIVWTNAQVETSSDLMFHSIGTQAYYKRLPGPSGTSQCQTVSSVTSGDTFTIADGANLC